MSLDPDKIYAAVSKAGEEWADKKAAYEMLDDLTSTIKADLTTDIMTGYKCSKGEAETRALAHLTYKEHLARLATARREWLHAEVRYKSSVMLADLRRSQESTARAEMQLR